MIDIIYCRNNRCHNNRVSASIRQVEDLRYAGPASFGTRKIVDEYDAKLAEARPHDDDNFISFNNDNLIIN